MSKIRGCLSEEELLDVRYEDFSASAPASLASICRFLGVDADPDYLQDCASIVEPTSNKARDLIDWTDEDRRQGH